MDRAVVVDMGSLALITAAIVARRGFVELVDQMVVATLVETLRCIRLVGSGHDAKGYGRDSIVLIVNGLAAQGTATRWRL